MLKLLLILLFVAGCLIMPVASAELSVSVEIAGVTGELADNVKLFLSIEQQKNHPLLSQARLQRLHARAEQEIATALQPYGYYRPKIVKRLQQLEAQQWQAVYEIDPGQPLPVGESEFVVLGGIRQESEMQALLAQAPLVKGAAFNHLKYEELKSALQKIAAELGYFDARFSRHRVEVDLQQYQARVQLHFDGGLRYRFGDIHMPQDVLKPSLLNRYVPFEADSPYRFSQLIELQQALTDSDYFKSVEVYPGKPDEDGMQVPVEVKLLPRKAHRYLLGLGYGTDTGARARFGWDMPRINNRGHRFNSEIKLSEIGYSAAARYRVPVLNPRTDEMIYSTAVENSKTETSESTLRTIGVGLHRGRGRWRESLTLNYQREDFVIAEDSDSAILLLPGIQWTLTQLAKTLYPREGFRFDIGARAAHVDLLSDVSFLQVQSGLKFIWPAGGRNRMLLNGRVGSTNISEFEELPSSVRFFAGGSQSVRGYAYQSLGPEDENGEVVGGKHLMLGSVEFEHPFSDKWSTALFYDVGNAIDALDDELEHGAGFGFRWQSPVGAIRIDLASAISRDGAPWRLHINIGPDL